MEQYPPKSSFLPLVLPYEVIYIIRMSSEKPFLCRLPFQFVSRSQDGVGRPCCFYILSEEERKDSQLKGSVEEAFNSSTFKNIREKMLRKEFVKGCQICYNSEKAGIKSFGRRMSNHFITHYPDDTEIKGLDIALSRECNLACRMCNSNYSTKWDEISKKLNQHVPHCDVNIDNIITKKETYRSVNYWKIIGGEPFISKSFYNFLDKIEALDLTEKTVEISTNCTIFPKPKYVDILLKAKQILLGVSIDGIGALGEYIRTYSKWQQVDKTAKLWSELAIKHPSLKVHTHVTVSIYNIHDLYSIFKWTQDKNIIFKYHILYGPKYLQCWTLPKDIREKIYDYYMQFPDFQNELSKLRNFLFEKQNGNIKDFLDFNDKMDQICKKDFFQVNTFYTRKDLEKAIYANPV